MKAVILAGGTGSRLRPLTNLINKHLLPVGRELMIDHAIGKLKDAGIRDILLVTGRPHAGWFTSYLGSGRDAGVSITYRVQEEAGGIAEALAQAESFVGAGEKFVVLLGDNLFEEPLQPHLEAFKRQPNGALVLLKKVDDPRPYGVPTFNKKGAITGIVEKPEHPPSPYCVTGIYMYGADVFDRIRRIGKSGRGELEITDVNNMYASSGELAYRELTGWWTDAGTFDSLHEASSRIREAER